MINMSSINVALKRPRTAPTIFCASLNIFRMVPELLCPAPKVLRMAPNLLRSAATPFRMAIEQAAAQCHTHQQSD